MNKGLAPPVEVDHMLIRVLLAIEKSGLRRDVRRALADCDVQIESVRQRRQLWEFVARGAGDLVVISASLLQPPVQEKIRVIKELPESPWVVVLTEKDNPSSEAQFLAVGCEAVLYGALPFDILKEALQAIVCRRAGAIQSVDVSSRLKRTQPRLSDFVSNSLCMKAFMDVVERVVPSDASLLIQGETGVGKERLARAIHTDGPRSTGPFIAVNCGALPDSLLESELFGHEEGAFTGATRARRGWFELAHGGTIFLDEIAEMPLHLQVKLLRVLQEHEIQRVGSERSTPIDVRVFAATNKSVEDEVEAGRFRRDLFYRLGVVTLTVPPLRDRAEDIPELVESYMGHFRSRIDKGIVGVTPRAIQDLVRYSWPGNIRELINVIERAVILCETDMVDICDLPTGITGGIPGRSGGLFPRVGEAIELPERVQEMPLREARAFVLERFERAYLSGLLRRTGGKIGETAKLAGVRPRSLFDRMKALGLKKEDFR